MRFLLVFVLLVLVAPAAAQESLPDETAPATGEFFGGDPFFVTEVPGKASTSAAVDRTCCGSEHLDHGDRYYTGAEQYGFNTRREPELVEFQLLVTDEVEAPAPKPRQVVDEWNK